MNVLAHSLLCYLTGAVLVLSVDSSSLLAHLSAAASL